MRILFFKKRAIVWAIIAVVAIILLIVLLRSGQNSEVLSQSNLHFTLLS